MVQPGGLQMAVIPAATGTVVAAVTGKSIVVVAVVLTATTAATGVHFESNTTDLTLAMNVGASIPIMLAADGGVLQTQEGEALEIDVATGATAGWVAYRLV